LRFYALYDKIYREDILAHAYAQCRSNKGAPGVDRRDFADVEAYGVERWPGELALALSKVPEGELDFLDFTFGRMYSPRTGQALLGRRPSKKSITHAIATIHALTDQARTWQEATELVGRLNRTLRGWANYFQVGSVSTAYRAIDTYSAARLRRWLRKKHKVRRCGYMAYPPEYLYRTLGLIRLSELKRNVPWAKA
jgi:hypothetical protein